MSVLKQYGPAMLSRVRNVGIGQRTLVGISSGAIGILAVVFVFIGTILGSSEGAGGCFDISENRAKFINKGANEFQMAPAEGSPIVINMLERSEFIGAIKFYFIDATDSFDIDSVVDSGCTEVEEVAVWDDKDNNAKSPVSSGTVLVNWSTLLIPFGDRMYDIILAYDDEVEVFSVELTNS